MTKTALSASPPSTAGADFIGKGFLPFVALGALFGGGGGALFGLIVLFMIGVVADITGRSVQAFVMREWAATFRCRRCGAEFDSRSGRDRPASDLQ